MFSKYKMVTKKLKKVCKHLKIRLTFMRNGKRIIKSEKVLLKQVKKKMKKVRFGSEKTEPWHKRHRKKLKIAAGILAAAVVLGGGHYAATRTEAGQKHLVKYNEFMKTTGKNIKPTGSKPEKSHTEPKVDPLEEQHKREIAFYTEQLNDPNIPPESKYQIQSQIFEKTNAFEGAQAAEAREKAEKEKAEKAASKERLLTNGVGILNLATGNGAGGITTGNPLLDPFAQQAATKAAELAKAHVTKLLAGGEQLEELQQKLENETDPVEKQKLEVQIAQTQEENTELAEETAEVVTNNKEMQKIVENIATLNKQLDNLKSKPKQTPKIKKNITGINKRIAKYEKNLEKLSKQQSSFGKRRKHSRKSSFGKNYRQRIKNIYISSKNIYNVSKKKFYEVSKIIAKGMLSGIGIFTGVTISIIALFKYMEYRKIKLDPMVVLRLFKATDLKGNLHVDKFVNSAKRTFDTHAPHFVGTLAKEVRKEIPGVVQEVTMNGLGVIQQNSAMLMMPMMMALSGYFSKQMGDLTVASVKKSRNVSGKKGWETRKKNESKKISREILSDIVNNSYQTAQQRNAAATKIQQMYKKRLPSLRYKRHLKEHKQITSLQIRKQTSDALNKLREQLRVHRFGRRKF